MSRRTPGGWTARGAAPGAGLGRGLGTRAGTTYGMVPYRWAVLAAVMLANATIQVLWISYAPITATAAGFYGVGDTAIGAFSMAFMVAFLPLSIPASWLIDTRGVRVAVGLGTLLAGIGGLGRGLAGDAYWLAFAFNALIAAAQPLLLNSWAATSTAWFDRGSRAFATGLMTLANLLGTAFGMVATPDLGRRLGVAGAQTAYGVAMLASAVVFVLVVRDRPQRAPDPDLDEERALVVDGLRHAVRVRPFLRMLLAVFLLMGTFNGVTTWVERILAPRGFSEDDAGLFGAVLLLTGIAGALILSGVSDRSGRRVPYLALAAAGAAPALLGVAFAPSLPLLLIAGAALGFFLTAALPIAIEYAAEVTRPTPEGTSNGLLQLVGQASVVVVYLMAAFRSGEGSFTPALIGLAVVLLAVAVLAARLPEPGRYLDEHLSPLDRST